MVRYGQFWRWSNKPDKCTYEWHSVIGKIEFPKAVSKRNQYSVPELDNFSKVLILNYFLP